MPRMLVILALLTAGTTHAGGRLPGWPDARSEPRWPSLPKGQDRALPASGFTTAEDAQGDGGMSPGEAARRAQEMNNGGRVLSVEPAGGGWRVKLIKNGDVRIVFVPD